jgi:hypothetical protein
LRKLPDPRSVGEGKDPTEERLQTENERAASLALEARSSSIASGIASGASRKNGIFASRNDRKTLALYIFALKVSAVNL